MKSNRKIPLIENVNIEKTLRAKSINEDASPNGQTKSSPDLRPFSESKTYKLFDRPVTAADYK